jgi:hypothetical protein
MAHTKEHKVRSAARTVFEAHHTPHGGTSTGGKKIATAPASPVNGARAIEPAAPATTKL